MRIGTSAYVGRPGYGRRLGGHGHDAEPRRLDAGPRAGRHLQLAQDVRHVMVDRPGRHVKAKRDLRVAEPVGDQGEHLQLAAGQVRRVLARARPGAAGDPAHAAPAQTPRVDGRGAAGAQLLQPPVRILQPVAARTHGDGRLVRAAQPVPGGCGILVAAVKLERPRLGDRVRDRLVDPRPPPPACELAEHPWNVRVPGEREGAGRQLVDVLLIAGQPGRLGASDRQRPDPVELVRGELDLRRLLERLTDAGVAPARPDGGQHEQALEPWRGRVAQLPGEPDRDLRRRVEATLVQL